MGKSTKGTKTAAVKARKERSLTTNLSPTSGTSSTSRAKTASRASKTASRASKPVSRASKPASRASKPASRASKAASRASKPASRASKPASRASKPASRVKTTSHATSPKMKGDGAPVTPTKPRSVRPPPSIKRGGRRSAFSPSTPDTATTASSRTATLSSKDDSPRSTNSGRKLRRNLGNLNIEPEENGRKKKKVVQDLPKAETLPWSNLKELTAIAKACDLDFEDDSPDSLIEALYHSYTPKHMLGVYVMANTEMGMVPNFELFNTRATGEKTFVEIISKWMNKEANLAIPQEVNVAR